MVTTRNGTNTLADLQRRKLLDIFDKVGRKDITLVKNTNTKNVMGRLLTQTEATTYNVVGDLQYVNVLDKQWLDQGIAKIGDGVFYCKNSEDIDPEDEITVDNVAWECIRQVEGETINGELIYQAWIVRRRENG